MSHNSKYYRKRLKTEDLLKERTLSDMGFTPKSIVSNLNNKASSNDPISKDMESETISVNEMEACTSTSSNSSIFEAEETLVNKDSSSDCVPVSVSMSDGVKKKFRSHCYVIF